LQQRIICTNEGGKKILNADFMMIWKVYIIFFLFVLWLNICGVFSALEERGRNFTQYFRWIGKALPGKTNLHVVGLAAFCWALWKLRN
jgi:hypothetical protein